MSREIQKLTDDKLAAIQGGNIWHDIGRWLGHDIATGISSQAKQPIWYSHGYPSYGR